MWTRRHVRIWFREHVKIVKFADDAKIIRLKDGYEAAYRCGVKQLDLWCSQNNLDLNMLKDVAMTVDFRRKPSPLSPLTLFNTTMDAVETFRFQGFTISHDLKWSPSTDMIIKKAQKRMYFLHQQHYCRPLITTCSNSSPLIGQSSVQQYKLLSV